MLPQTRRFRTGASLALLLTVLLLAACGDATLVPSSAPTVGMSAGTRTGIPRAGASPAAVVPLGSTTATRPTTTEKVSLIFPGPGSFIFLPFEVARLKNFYADEGLVVDATYGKTGPAGVTALNSSNADFAGTTIDLALTNAQQGQTITAVASLTRLPGFGVVTSPGSAGTLTTLANLSGKSIGISSPNAGDDVILHYLLKKAGVDVTKVEFSPLGTDESKANAVQANRVAAVILSEPALSRVQASGGRILVNLFDGVQAKEYFPNGYQFTGLFVRPDTIQKRPEAVARMAHAIARADRFIAATPGAEIVALLSDDLIPGGDRAAYAKMIDDYKAAIISPDGVLVPEAVAEVARAQILSGISGTPPSDLAPYYTNRFVTGAGR